MGDRHIEKHTEKTGSHHELTFNQVMDLISMEQASRRNLLDKKEDHHVKPPKDSTIDFTAPIESKPNKFTFTSPKEAIEHKANQISFSSSKEAIEHKTSKSSWSEKHESSQSVQASAPENMKYDEASNSYQTNDGYILPLGGPKIERLSGYVLKDQLNQIEAGKTHPDNTAVLPPEVIAQRQAEKNSLVSLPNSHLNYATLANGLNGRSLYAPPSTECSETSVSVDAHVLGIAGGGMTIYDKQNDDCRLAKTVAQSCAITELLATDVQNATSPKDMMKRSDAVRTASDYCAETIEAVKKEEKRLKEEAKEEDDD